MLSIKKVKLLETENDLLKAKIRDYEVNYNQLKEEYRALELEQIAQGKRTCTGYCSVCKNGVSMPYTALYASPMQNTASTVYCSTMPETRYSCLLDCKCPDFKNKYE